MIVICPSTPGTGEGNIARRRLQCGAVMKIDAVIIRPGGFAPAADGDAAHAGGDIAVIEIDAIVGGAYRIVSRRVGAAAEGDGAAVAGDGGVGHGDAAR